MTKRSFVIRRELIFPSEEQKIRLESLFFITRYLSNRYNNHYNQKVSGYGRTKPLSYGEMEAMLIQDIEQQEQITPGTITQALNLHPRLLKPCLREIESQQRKAYANPNYPVKFIYPRDKQRFWVSSQVNMLQDWGDLSIPGEPTLRFPIQNKNSQETLYLFQVVKTPEGDYYLDLLFENERTELNQDKEVIMLNKQLEVSERKKDDYTRNSFLRSQVRRSDDKETKSFVYRRSIFNRLKYLEVSPAAQPQFDEFEEGEVNVDNDSVCSRWDRD